MREHYNRNSALTRSVMTRLWCISTYGLSGLRNGDEHPAYSPPRSVGLYLLEVCIVFVKIS